MKRIQLFEIEDFHWYPSFLRNSLTRLMNVMHRLVGTSNALLPILESMLKDYKLSTITDMASGDGGPLPEIVATLHQNNLNISLVLSDLYPNKDRMENLPSHTKYLKEPVNALHPESLPKGLRTMICSFHHMPEKIAGQILTGFQSRNEACVIYEMSDNSSPKFLWWTAIPINFLSCLFITPMCKNITFSQIVFTYLIPIIPISFAWDGAVSNARTYTVNDLDVLLSKLPSSEYQWEKKTLPGKMKKLVLIGRPA